MMSKEQMFVTKKLIIDIGQLIIINECMNEGNRKSKIVNRK